jgi:hypothetical protein
MVLLLLLRLLLGFAREFIFRVTWRGTGHGRSRGTPQNSHKKKKEEKQNSKKRGGGNISEPTKTPKSSFFFIFGSREKNGKNNNKKKFGNDYRLSTFCFLFFFFARAIRTSPLRV